MKADDVTQGAMANRRGEALLDEIAALLAHAGLCLDATPRTLAGMRAAGDGTLWGAGCFCREVTVGRCSYGRPLILPFVVSRPAARWPGLLGVEAQGQERTGSADNKLVKTMRDLCLAPLSSVLVLAGAHMAGDRGILDFARGYAAATRGKILRVFVGMDEVRRWATAGLPWPREETPSLPC